MTLQGDIVKRAPLDANELWEFLFGEFEGAVPEALSDAVLGKMAAHITEHFIAPAATEIEALRIERDARPTQENAFKAIEAARAEERAKREAEIASLRADCRMKDELLTAAVDDYDKAAKEVAALRTALDEWKGAAFASRLEESEACAKIAEDEDGNLPRWGEDRNQRVADQTKAEIAAAIRARKKQGVEK